MSYAFTHNKSVGQQVRHIAKEQVQKGRQQVLAAGDFDAIIHSLRRRCKKVRGLLRLVEPRFEDFADENAALRATANALGASRDAAVVIETFDGLVAGRGGDLPAEGISGARQYLLDRMQKLALNASKDAVLADFDTAFAALEQRIERWRFSASGAKLVTEGMRTTYGRMRKAAKRAEASGDSHDMHEWRKHAKNHLYHVTLLEKSAPDVLKPLRHKLDILGELLGDHHNLAVLGEVLDQYKAAADFAQAIAGLIAEQQNALAAQAFALGRQVMVEKPSALEKRFAGYFALFGDDDDGH